MNIEKEVWKPVEGYEGLYEVSNLGRVKSLFDGRHKIFREKILKPNKVDKLGHLQVALYKNGERKNLFVHRLVGLAFVPGWFEESVINHKDHDPKNNTATNLEWTTQKDNSSGEKSFSAEVNKKLLSKEVLQYTKNGDFIREWTSTMECERNGFNHARICSCCLGKRRFHKNFRWFYKDDLVYFF